jgi:zinc D-Ala-D-Ala carboxypeptidase
VALVAVALAVACCSGAAAIPPDRSPSAGASGSAVAPVSMGPGVTYVAQSAAPLTAIMPYEADPAPVSPPTNLAPLPACVIADVATPLSALRDWRLTLVDWTYELPEGYQPNDLVPTSEAGIYGSLVREFVIPDLKALVGAIHADGIGLDIVSAYRSRNEQSDTFWGWVDALGADIALQSSARPGHSEHQLGVAIDFEESGGPMPWTYYDWSRDTATGVWMAANAWRYGFVMSYPVGKAGVTCYGFEPWHYRYVGRPEAEAIHDSGLTPREWIWTRQPQQSSATPSPS